MFERLHEDDASWLGKRFEEAREEAGLEIAECAREVGFVDCDEGVEQIRIIEAGEDVLPEIDMLRQVADVLGVDLERLWSEVEHRRKQRLEAGPPKVLGTLLQHRREAMGWTVHQVVEESGLEPVDDYRKWLESLESGRVRFPAAGELRALCTGLDLSEERAIAALKQEGAYYDRLGNGPRFIERYMPAMYGEITSRLAPGEDDDVETLRALEIAEEYAEAQGRSVAVVLGDGRSIYIDGNGQRRESLQAPAMVVGSGSR